MQIKLKSKKTLEVKDISVDDRDALLDGVEYEYNEDGSFKHLKMMHSTMTKWIRICVKSDDTETFLKSLNLEERTEIFTELQARFFEGEGKASK